jgi:pyruvate,water dikinase
VGSKIGQGKAHRILSAKDISQFKKGEVLITDATDPDWVPAMKMASAIITDRGGRTCHSAIVGRELGIPTVVGTGNATKKIKTGESITVSCAEGEVGKVYKGIIPFEIKRTDISSIPRPPFKVMMNLGDPSQAFKMSFIPNDGVGLAREEFIIANYIKIHPLALLNFKKMPLAIRKKIELMTEGWKDKEKFFIDKLTEGVGKIAAAFYPKEVIVRFSDFKTNEYRGLIGGEIYEPEEENPMIGWRGASRYYSEKFSNAFVLECQAIKKAREEFGLTNISVMVPFCRTIGEGKRVLEIVEKNGLKKGDLRVYVMCEIPSNAILVDEFLDIFDGMSIGSNDLTQLVLGLDRDNSTISGIADENHEAVKKLIRRVIKACKERGKYCGICGQAPSDFPDFAEFLVKEGIQSISLNPDTIIKTILFLSQKT